MVRTVSKNKYLLWKWSEKPSRLIFTRVSPFLIKWEGLKMKVRHVPSFELPHNKGCICVKGRHVKPCMTPLKCTPWLDTRQCVYICSEVSYPNKPTWISPTPRLRCLPRRISPVRRPSSTFVGDQCSCQVHHTSATSRLGNEWRIQDHPFVKHKNDSSRNQAGWDFVNDIVLQSCAFDPDLKWTYGIPCSTIFFSQWQTHQSGRLLPSLPGQTGLGNKSRPSKLSNISSCEVVFNIGPSAWKLLHNDVLAQFLPSHGNICTNPSQFDPTKRMYYRHSRKIINRRPV